MNCRICNQDKILEEFSSFNKNGKIYHSKMCKICKNKYNKQYRLKYPEKLKENNKKFRLNNPNYMKEYYELNPNKKIGHNYQIRLTYCIDKNLNTLQDIIGCDIDNLKKWLDFTKIYYCDINIPICIEHLINIDNYDLQNNEELKSYMNWKNLRVMNSIENSRKNKFTSFEDKFKQCYLLKCFKESIKPEIKYVKLY